MSSSSWPGELRIHTYYEPLNEVISPRSGLGVNKKKSPRMEARGIEPRTSSMLKKRYTTKPCPPSSFGCEVDAYLGLCRKEKGLI